MYRRAVSLLPRRRKRRDALLQTFTERYWWQEFVWRYIRAQTSL